MAYDNPTAEEAVMMQRVAEEAASQAVAAVKAELEANLRAMVKETIQEELRTALGEGGAQAHLVQHARIDRFLGFVDKVSDNFWGTVVKTLAKWIVYGVVLGFVYYMGGGRLPKIGG